MRIASFNINGIKARLPRLKEWLEDVDLLQEVLGTFPPPPRGLSEVLDVGLLSSTELANNNRSTRRSVSRKPKPPRSLWPKPEAL